MISMRPRRCGLIHPGLGHTMSHPMVVGVRITKETGLAFFGVDEVNAALREGKKVTAIEPGDAIFQKVAEDQENVRLTLSGFTIKVVVEG